MPRRFDGDERGFFALFKVGNVVYSGGGQKQFEIGEIGSEAITIRPTSSKRRLRTRLTYRKLNATIEGFHAIDPQRIEKTFQQVLTNLELPKDHTNEAYLWVGQGIEGQTDERVRERPVLPRRDPAI